MLKRSLVVAVGLVAVGIGIVYLGKYGSQKSDEAFVPSVVEPGALANIKQHEHIIGNIKAPLVVIEYASFSCTHCATFALEIFPEIKKKYIDTGKVLFVFRDMPTDPYSFKASVLAACYAPTPDDPSFSVIYHRLFKTSSEWAFNKNYMEIFLPMSEMSKEAFDNCMSSRKIEAEILQNKIEAIKDLGITAVPSFLIGNKLYKGYRSKEKFEAAIEHGLLEALGTNSDPKQSPPH